MLLVIDVGNTNTVFGIYADQCLRGHWRISTNRAQTVDEYGLLIRNLLALDGLESGVVKHVMIASVVPPLNSVLEEMVRKYFHLTPVFLGPGTRTGMPIHYDNPQEVGADRITNTVGSMQSGLFYGAIGLVDGILDRLCAILGKGTHVIATGGQASWVAPVSKYKPPVEGSLTLEGLRIIHERHLKGARRRA